MLRFVNICLLLGLLALAYVIYQVKYETRALDAEIATIGKDIEGERDAIAVLRAEWSLLNRPERIERLAKKHLKLAPSDPRQLVTVDSVTDSDFDRLKAQAQAAQQADAAQASPKKVSTQKAGIKQAAIKAAAN
jgi:cell division protein FtsL